MTNEQDLDQLLESENKTYFKFAVKLYLESLKNKLFPDIAIPLLILKWVFNTVEENGHRMFRFIPAYQEIMQHHRLNDAQTTFLHKFLRDYALAMCNDYKYGYRASYHDCYAPYFTTLAQIDQEARIAEAIVQTDPTQKVHEAIQRQMLLLSEEMETQPTEARIKTLGALVKITGQYERIRAQQQKNPKTAPKTEEPTPVVNIDSKQPATAPINPLLANPTFIENGFDRLPPPANGWEWPYLNEKAAAVPDTSRLFAA